MQEEGVPTWTFVFGLAIETKWEKGSYGTWICGPTTHESQSKWVPFSFHVPLIETYLICMVMLILLEMGSWARKVQVVYGSVHASMKPIK